MINKFLFSILVLFLSCSNFATGADLETAFKNYQSGEFDQSKNQMEEALKSQPHNSYLIYNLGLVEYKRGKTGMAIALWRRALSLNPNLSEAKKALQFAIAQMPVKPLSPNVESSLDWVEKIITDHVSINVLWPLLLVIAVLFFKLLFSYLGARRKAFLEDQPAPSLPTNLILYGGVFAATTLVAIVSVSDLLQTRATVVAANAQVKTGPAAENVTLFEIPEGTELILDEKNGPWYKVEDPTGRTGWISAETIYMTSEKFL